jgi:hypothetical protein
MNFNRNKSSNHNNAFASPFTEALNSFLVCFTLVVFVEGGRVNLKCTN